MQMVVQKPNLGYEIISRVNSHLTHVSMTGKGKGNKGKGKGKSKSMYSYSYSDSFMRLARRREEREDTPPPIINDDAASDHLAEQDDYQIESDLDKKLHYDE